ncbi:UNVERIFIED_CONTAM: hypothetical protein FKN15_001372 [Acipenser sinensis]
MQPPKSYNVGGQRSYRAAYRQAVLCLCPGSFTEGGYAEHSGSGYAARSGSGYAERFGSGNAERSGSGYAARSGSGYAEHPAVGTLVLGTPVVERSTAAVAMLAAVQGTSSVDAGHSGSFDTEHSGGGNAGSGHRGGGDVGTGHFGGGDAGGGTGHSSSGNAGSSPGHSGSGNAARRVGRSGSDDAGSGAGALWTRTCGWLSLYFPQQPAVALLTLEQGEAPPLSALETTATPSPFTLETAGSSPFGSWDDSGSLSGTRAGSTSLSGASDGTGSFPRLQELHVLPTFILRQAVVFSSLRAISSSSSSAYHLVPELPARKAPTLVLEATVEVL